MYNLLQQTANAYNQDMGITSSFVPKDTYTGNEIDAEVSDQTVYSVVFYLQTSKAPLQRDPGNTDVQAGKQIFIDLGCEKCHRQILKTGYSKIDALSYKEFHPYTDLLLHDMGPGLDDGYTEGGALTGEWRTAPLWGLGLSPRSQGGQYYLLHDGRAHSIETAITMHGGEANTAKEKFVQLKSDDKTKLMQFLSSL